VPSSSRSLSPQHHMDPAVVSAHVWLLLTAIAASVRAPPAGNPETATGTLLAVVDRCQVRQNRCLPSTGRRRRIQLSEPGHGASSVRAPWAFPRFFSTARPPAHTSATGQR
jgi:hypothetical protein